MKINQAKISQFSEDNSISEATAKKVLSVIYSKGKDAKKLESVLRRMEMMLKKTKIPELMNKMTTDQIGQIVDEMIADYLRDMNLSQEVSCSEFTAWGFSELGEFAKKTFEAGDEVSLQILRTGKWNHPMYGEIEITNKTIKDVMKNFNEDTRGIDLAVDENHEPNHKALGWFRKLEEKGKNALFGTIELTKRGAELLSEGAYKYFSPEIFFNKKDEETGSVVKNLLIGGAFTNRPFFKAMQPLLASEEGGQEGAADRHQNKDSGSVSESNILFFNTSKSMKKILELIAQFNEMPKLNKAQVAELDAAFSEVGAEFKTAELTAAITDLKAKFTDEGEDGSADDAETDADDSADEGKDKGSEDPATDKKEDAAADEAKAEEKKDEETDPATTAEDESEKKIEANEKGEVTLKFSEYENLKNLASETGKLVREARKTKLDQEISGLVFSETNSKGVVLPKRKQEIVDFALSLSEKQSDKFLKIIGGMQAISAGEIGHSDENAEAFTEANAEQIRFFTENMGMNKDQAIEAVKAANDIASKK